jgi:hypothetical protein
VESKFVILEIKCIQLESKFVLLEITAIYVIISFLMCSRRCVWYSVSAGHPRISLEVCACVIGICITAFSTSVQNSSLVV